MPRIRIKIRDLPEDAKVSPAEVERVRGGLNPQPEPPSPAGLGKFFDPATRVNPLTRGIEIKDGRGGITYPK